MWSRIASLVCWAIGLGWAMPVHAGYVAELQQLARERQLADSPVWRNLLHYKRHPLTGYRRSLADDPGFFLAEDGSKNAQAELDATLASFLAEPSASAGQHPQCRFIARFRWLDEQLGFDGRLPRQRCDRYASWRGAMNPAGLTLVFPTGYLSSPASMYGHTMFRVDAVGQSDQDRLLAYTISYAAQGNPGDGITFAFKGLAGLYPGVFASSPYYRKVAEYSDLENRDVWEYRLDLTQAEIERILEHVWELGQVRFDYYFFDENCAYHLLSLLDVARPSLALTDQFVWHAIPADTVRAMVEAPGLLKSVTYRPSNASLIQHRSAGLSGDELALVDSLAHGRLSASELTASVADPAQRGRLLELADLQLTYLQPGSTLSEREFNARSRALLLARSLEPSVVSDLPAVPAVRPEEGHLSGRVHLAAGRVAGQTVAELRLRPAYHDLLDAEAGFTRGAALQFFDLAVRLREGQRARLHYFTPVDIQSLTPRRPLLGGKSWRVRFGARRFTSASGEEPLAAELQGGPGLAFDRGVLGYLFLDNHLLASNRLHKGYAAGMGMSAGMLADISSAWRLQLQGGRWRYLAGDRQLRGSLELNQRWQVARNQAIRLELSRTREGAGADSSGLLGWTFYF